MSFARPNAPDITPTEAYRRQQHGAAIVDVREPGEWAAGHAAGALHMPLGQVAYRQSELSREREGLLICASDNRSMLTAELLGRAGHPRAASIGGGTDAWARAGLPLDR